MFYKFGDNTSAKTVVKTGDEKNSDDKNIEIFDKNDDKNRRSLIMNKYDEEEEKKEG